MSARAGGGNLKTAFRNHDRSHSRTPRRKDALSGARRISRAARRGRSAIIVSHRLSAVADADHIVVLKEGRVVEEGAHPALVARDGWYAAQWRYQQLEASLEDA